MDLILQIRILVNMTAGLNGFNILCNTEVTDIFFCGVETLFKDSTGLINGTG
jgi:hypothetical protein